MGRTWNHEQRTNKQTKKSFVKFKQERRTKRHMEEYVPPKKGKDG